MDLMKHQPSDSCQSPVKTQPSDQATGSLYCPTPNKLTKTLKNPRPSLLPPNSEMLLKFFDALDSSLKLLRLRRSIPIFTQLRAMVEKISDRRFTFQHLAQLKYLLREEMQIKRVLTSDDETRCMKYDIHVSFNVSMMTKTKKRKRGSKYSCLRDCFISRLLQFLRTHPEGTEVPGEELPEPFNQREEDLLLNPSKQPGSLSCERKSSDVSEDMQSALASHFPISFKKHFSNRDSGIESGNSYHSPSKLLRSPPSSVSKTSAYGDLVLAAATFVAVPSNQNAIQSDGEPFTVDKTCSAQTTRAKAATPSKSAGSPILMDVTPSLMTPKRYNMSPNDNFPSSPTEAVDRPSCASSLVFGDPLIDVKVKTATPTKTVGSPFFMASTPALMTPKRCSSSPDDNISSSPIKAIDRRSCARSLLFNDPLRDANIELHLDDADCSNILDILPENLLQSLKEKGKTKAEQPNRKFLISRLPKLFDRIYYLFQSPKCSFIKKEAVIHELTKCHPDITDESEVKEQLKLLQEIIPEWICHKLSPSGNILYSVNKGLNSNTLRLKLAKAN